RAGRWGWGNPPWGHHQRRSVCLVFVGSACCCMSVCQVLRSMLERRMLQALCARRQFDRRWGLPPLEMGMISSTSGLPGCGVGSVWSTGSPHRWQLCSSRRTRLRIARRFVPFCVRGSLRLLVDMFACEVSEDSSEVKVAYAVAGVAHCFVLDVVWLLWCASGALRLYS